MVVIMEPKPAIFEFAEGRKVIGCQDLSWDDRKVNLNVVQPTDMDQRGQGDERRPLGVKATRILPVAMTRSIVRNPEDAAGRKIGLLVHDLRDQAIKKGRCRSSVHSGWGPWRTARPRPPDKPKLLSVHTYVRHFGGGARPGAWKRAAAAGLECLSSRQHRPRSRWGPEAPPSPSPNPIPG